MAQKIAERTKVIDVDSHVIEPYDLWTSRVSSKWGDLIPHVQRVEKDCVQEMLMIRPGDDVWVMDGGGDMTDASILTAAPVGVFGMAGWSDPLPSHPPTLRDMAPSAYDPAARLRLLDEYGIYAQILYPNVGCFGERSFVAMPDADLKRDCVRAYNDFITAWCSEDPARLIPLTSTPFWDLDLMVEEIHRCAKLGHRGILFTWTPQSFGMPYLGDPFWDPLWECCAAHELPINFHIGSGSMAMPTKPYPGNGFQVNYGNYIVQAGLNLATAIADLIGSGLLLRHPTLKFVVVESGVGWIPYVLEQLTWLWNNSGVYQERPELMGHSPIEQFKQSIYGTFWFEDACLKAAVDVVGPDNFMFETDYPHPTSVAPGPNTTAKNPIEHIEDRFSNSELSEETINKLLHGNAAKLYRIT
jgi:predicted TIM-barrel fold metal-dependent hydrolase